MAFHRVIDAYCQSVEVEMGPGAVSVNPFEVFQLLISEALGLTYHLKVKIDHSSIVYQEKQNYP